VVEDQGDSLADSGGGGAVDGGVAAAAGVQPEHQAQELPDTLLQREEMKCGLLAMRCNAMSGSREHASGGGSRSESSWVSACRSAHLVLGVGGVLHERERRLQRPERGALVPHVLNHQQGVDNRLPSLEREPVVCGKLLKGAQRNAGELGVLAVACVQEGLEKVLGE
jgi:hypothetical protein